MNYYLKYEMDTQRLIMAVVNDARSVIPLLVEQDGNAIYAYSQGLIALMVPGVILYRIETLNGNLGGIVAINTNLGAVGVVFLQLRPAAVPFLSQISQIINTFIQENTFLQDVLY
jgi:hypothetical protein